MFTHNPVEQINIEQVTYDDGYRLYRTPEGNEYPSVTTMLSSDPKKQQGLEEWRNRIGHDEANRITQKAAERGESLHTAIENYLQNQKFPLKEILPESQIFFKKMKKEIDKLDNIRAQEIPLYSDKLQLAGTCDLIAEYNGKLSVIDFKTSRKPKKLEWCEDYFLQTLIYSIMFQELYGLTINQLCIIIGDEESQKGYTFTANRKNYLDSLKTRIKDFRKRNEL